MDIKEAEERMLKKKVRMSADRRLIKLNEEIGEVNQAYIKKSKNKACFVEECGDVIYRLALLLDKKGSSLEKAIAVAVNKYGSNK